MNGPVIVLDHLSKSFGDVHAVQDLSLHIEAGTIFRFLGPNGAGKTTTMRMLCGLTHPTAGRATIEGAYAVPGAELGPRIERLLQVIDLQEKRDVPAQSLSGGMRQLLAIGCALVHNPSLLFFDQHTVALHSAQRH